MKKTTLKLTVLLFCILMASMFFTGCSEGKKDKEPETYDISPVNSALVTIEPSVASATAGTKINVKVTLQTDDSYLKGVYYNDKACTKTDDGYFFTMPAERVIITAETATYTEVLQNGFATFSDDNYKIIAMNAKHDSDNDSEWALTVDMNSSYMAILNTEIISSDQNVIPSNAVKVVQYSKKDLGISGANDFEIVKAKILIDTSKIKVGSTWLTMNFVNGNTFDKASLAVNINVCEYGQISVQTINETLIFDFSQVETASQSYNISIIDADHIDGSKPKEIQNYTVNSNNGKIRLPIEYIKGHSYRIKISVGEEDDHQTAFLISAAEQGGAVYTGDNTTGGEGRLSFTEANSEINLTVTKKS